MILLPPICSRRLVGEVQGSLFSFSLPSHGAVLRRGLLAFVHDMMMVCLGTASPRNIPCCCCRRRSRSEWPTYVRQTKPPSSDNKLARSSYLEAGVPTMRNGLLGAIMSLPRGSLAFRRAGSWFLRARTSFTSSCTFKSERSRFLSLSLSLLLSRQLLSLSLSPNRGF